MVAMIGNFWKNAAVYRVLPSIAVAVVIAVSGAPALAQKTPPIEGGGSLPLNDVLRVAKPYPNLINEVRLALLDAGVVREQVICSGQRLSKAWAHLGGQRIAPYECRIGQRLLVVRAVASYFDRNGHKLGPAESDVPQKAVRLAEARLTWAWK